MDVLPREIFGIILAHSGVKSAAALAATNQKHYEIGQEFYSDLAAGAEVTPGQYRICCVSIAGYFILFDDDRDVYNLLAMYQDGICGVDFCAGKVVTLHNVTADSPPRQLIFALIRRIHPVLFILPFMEN